MFSWYLSACLLVTVTCITQAKHLQPIQHHGILFHQKGKIFLNQHEWNFILTTDASPLVNTMEVLKKHFYDLIKREPNAVEPNSVYLLIRYFNELTQTCSTIKEMSSPDKRFKCSPFECIANGLQWIYGADTDKDVEQLILQSKDTVSKQHGVLHIISKQLSIVNKTAQVQHSSFSKVVNLYRIIQTINDTLSKESHTRSAMKLKSKVIVQQYMKAYHELELHLLQFVHILQDSSRGALSSIVLPPETLLSTLSDIKDHLPSSLSFPFKIHPGTIFSVYPYLTYRAAYTRTNILHTVISVPLIGQTFPYMLYEIFALPIPTSYPNIFHRKILHYKYFAISTATEKSFLELNSLDLCTTNSSNYICSLQAIPIQTPEAPSCPAAVFLNQSQEMTNQCKFEIVLNPIPIFIKLYTNTWYVYTAAEQNLLWTCPEKIDKPATHKIKLANIIQLAQGCSVKIDHRLLPFSLEQNANITWVMPIELNLPTPIIVNETLNYTSQTLNLTNFLLKDSQSNYEITYNIDQLKAEIEFDKSHLSQHNAKRCRTISILVILAIAIGLILSVSMCFFKINTRSKPAPLPTISYNSGIASYKKSGPGKDPIQQQ